MCVYNLLQKIPPARLRISHHARVETSQTGSQTRSNAHRVVIVKHFSLNSRFSPFVQGPAQSYALSGTRCLVESWCRFVVVCVTRDCHGDCQLNPPVPGGEPRITVGGGLLPWALLLWVPLMMAIAFRSLPWKRIAAAVVLAIQGAVAFITPWLWMHGLKDYQRDRLVLFLDPSKDPLGGGYHLLQSTVGIGSGGLFGTGLLQGQLTKLRFIPEQHTDFIFSALGEETGYLGTVLVVVGFALLMARMLQVANRARSDFDSLVVIGVATMLMFQVVVNIFMTIGLGPVTGIPLPFMSYGRSAMVVNFIALGLCLSVARRERQGLIR